MEYSLFLNEVASFPLIRLHTEGLYFYIHSFMTISPFLILRKIWFREATIAVQLWALFLLFLQALAKILSDFDTRHKHNYVSDRSAMTWPNFYLPVSMFSDIYTCKNIYGYIWSYFKNFLHMQNTHIRNHHTGLKVFLCVFSKRADTLDSKQSFTA